MFHNCSSLITFASDLSSLTNGGGMFTGCSNINTFGCLNLKSLIGGQSMFCNCKNLTSANFNLKSLIYGGNMFAWCERLITFNSDLSSLADGNYMFYNCKNLTSFDSNLSSLTRGDNMFEGCSNLSSFKLHLNMLTNGSRMFVGCNNLTSFKSNLSSLTSGHYMFSGCKLDTASIKNIAETINTVTNSPSIHIGIGSTTPTEEENQYLTQIHEKGWQVFVNGSSDAYVPATATLDETGETMSAPIPFWAKPVPSDEENAQYVDSEGNFFNILGGQFIYVDDPDTYGMFINEEDAAAQMRLTKIEEKVIPSNS